MAEPSDPTRQFEKRLLAVGAVLILVSLLGVYGFWSWRTRHDLDAAIVGWRAAGEPVEVKDFVAPPPIPDGENAALVLLKAGKEIVGDGTPKELDLDTWEIPFSPVALRALEEYVRRNSAALADVRAARRLSLAQWNVPTGEWLSAKPTYGDHGQRGLAMILQLAILDRAQAGDESAAVENIRDLLHLADCSGQMMPTFGCTFLSIGIRAAATYGGEQLAATDVRATTRPATDAQRKALIAELLEETSSEREWAKAVIGERAIQLVSLRPEADKAFPGAAARQQLLLLLHDMTRTAEFGKLACWPAAETALRAFDRPAPLMMTPVGIEAENVRGLLSMVLQMRYKILAERRMVAVAMAIRWYRMDHGGRFPETLAALVPAYLERLPDDPFAAAPRAFVYLPADGKPRIYSVGVNGVDDGGSLKLLPHEQSMRTIRWAHEDAVMFLTPQAPTTRASNSN